MSWISDNPIPLFILGILAQLVLGVLLWQTGRAWIMGLMGVLAITSVGLVVAEVLITSPTEEVTDTLDTIAAALQTNDADRVLKFIAPESAAIRADATQQLKRVKISEAYIAGTPQIKFDMSSQNSLMATATFVGRFKATLVRETTPYEQAIVRFTLYFREQDGKWLVTNYEMHR